MYTALAGMNAYSQGLDVISNNVANLNTPGFKVADPVFREIVYRQLDTATGADGSTTPRGAGVEADSASLSFRQGELRDTGNSLDAAIDGDGFFVLDQAGERRYTRAGQFTYNDDGILVERVTGARVLIGTAESASGFFDINTARVNPPRATGTVTLTGTLARTSTSATYELPSITVYNSAGTAIPLRARFVRNSTDPLSWTVEVLGASNTVLGSGAIAFNADATPAEGSSSVTVKVEEGLEVTFDLGAAGTFSGVTSPATSTVSQLQALRQDGRPLGSLSRTEFDEQGQLKLTYSNGQTVVAGQLVLAQFDNPEQLRALDGGMFVAGEDATPNLGHALSVGLGRIVGGRLEMSNVELTQQFTDLIIMQRGYQASSQISSIANELIQTLLAMDGRR
jgi:flagellar hook protein FlgE